jgi:hypothetical protein
MSGVNLNNLQHLVVKIGSSLLINWHGQLALRDLESLGNNRSLPCHILAIIAEANSLHLTLVTPSISRAMS